jgi:hypothetical protein
MRAVVERTLRDRFAVVLLAGAAVPLVVALAVILVSAVSGSPSPQPAHLTAVPPLTTSPPPTPPPYTNLPFSTATPVPTPAPTPTPQTSPTPGDDAFNNLCKQTGTSVHDGGLAAALCQHLRDAEQHYQAGDLQAEANAVHTYVHDVRNAPRKVVSRDAANSLVAAADALPGMSSQSSG